MCRLVVLAPSIGNDTSQFAPLLERLAQDSLWGQTTRVLRYEHKASILSLKRADDLASDLAGLIDTEWDVAGPFDDILLVGHSLGGVLVRSAYLQGLGSQRNLQEPTAWASKVSRIVLFAAFNRGLHLRWHERFALVFMPWQSLLRDLLIGSDFVTNLRLWWIRKLTHIEVQPETQMPTVVQVRGTRDDRVEREDSLDVEGFLQGHQLFVDATHEGLLKPGPDGTIEDKRFSVFRHAVLGTLRETGTAQRRSDATTKVFFVVHGIRAANDNWVTDVSNRIHAELPTASIITPTYGRFSALQFAVPMLRRRKVRWFQDLYSLELAKNPLATFNFVGHSYGTYLFGHAIKRLSGIRFERVSLNGSVLPAQWLWDDYRGQVKELRNARASLDIPVGLLCSALRRYFMPDIGTAGYTGFHVPFANNTEFFFYKGGHSASVSGTGRKHIVDFILRGDTTTPATMVAKSELFSALSEGAWVLLPVIVAVLIVVALLISLLIVLPYHALFLHSLQTVLLLPHRHLVLTFLITFAVVCVIAILALLLV